MADANPLLSTARASDSSPQLQLHPLVLLTISDYITRHTLRKKEGPVVGAILGQQDGRNITMEVAFECLVKPSDSGEVLLDNEWFNDRLEQFKDVHKAPPLDLVGWFTLSPVTGPQPWQLSIHRYLQTLYNESALLLLFHPSAVLEGTATGGKLPLTIYESVMEPGAGAAMDIDGAAAGADGKELRFRELPYSVETGEAEMIGVDFVAKGGGNAGAVDGAKNQSGAAAAAAAGKSSTAKGKARAGDAQVNGTLEGEAAGLSPEDEELLSSLTAKQNAIHMLHQRIHLFRRYLSALPPSYLTDASLPFSTTDPANSPNNNPPPDHTILRPILALTSRLPLLTPPNESAFLTESLEQKSDVQLIDLLSSITSSLASAKELGRKSQVVEGAKASRRNARGGGMFGEFGMGMGGGGGNPFMETVMGGGGGAGGAYASPMEGGGRRFGGGQ